MKFNKIKYIKINNLTEQEKIYINKIVETFILKLKKNSLDILVLNMIYEFEKETLKEMIKNINLYNKFSSNLINIYNIKNYHYLILKNELNNLFFYKKNINFQINYYINKKIFINLKNLFIENLILFNNQYLEYKNIFLKFKNIQRTFKINILILQKIYNRSLLYLEEINSIEIKNIIETILEEIIIQINFLITKQKINSKFISEIQLISNNLKIQKKQLNRIIYELNYIEKIFK